ncbi:MAG TPA: methylmalonyl Co-A mutase-associated GTPase MeaB [Dehalococcoidia bacterium]|nr:methylmalonyl Co-A mutase-associated GTPase MeaB [Dehalococcoidia bacterium]
MMNELIDKMLAGDRLSLARLITMVEREGEEVPEIMRAIYPHTGRAYCVGITGPPGGGKSTMVSRLTALARKKELQVGVVAVDPTSPFSGGAVLGDRVRMQQHFLDDGVFIRSMATRGSHGGLPRTASSVIKLLDASGKDIIFLETVGVGQTEVDVMETADTVVVILVPEAGDTIQTMKAGLMEIADVFAVNKADRPGADFVVADLMAMLHQSPKQSWWQVPVIPTQAANDIGTTDLYQQIEKHYEALQQTGRLAQRRQKQRRADLLRNIENTVTTQIMQLVIGDDQLNRYLERVESGEIDPYAAADEILSHRTLVSWVEKWLARAKGTTA